MGKWISPSNCRPADVGVLPCARDHHGRTGTPCLDLGSGAAGVALNVSALEFSLGFLGLNAVMTALRTARQRERLPERLQARRGRWPRLQRFAIDIVAGLADLDRPGGVAQAAGVALPSSSAGLGVIEATGAGSFSTAVRVDAAPGIAFAVSSHFLSTAQVVLLQLYQLPSPPSWSRR